MSVPADYPMVYAAYRQRVSLSASVCELIHSHRQTGSDTPEAFGILVGTTSLDKKERWVDLATSPMAGDAQSRFHFSLKDPDHQRVVDEAHSKSEGSQIYLGTWHTHPEACPKPSGVDKADWRQCVKRNEQRPLLFIIAGIDEVKVFVPWGRHFRRLTRCEDTYENRC
tara:strand:- start:1296 stop:1799 length:504 start_codon:yes stop_codon:yes gene_type:complete